MSKEFKMVPGRMLLDRATIGAILFHCGDGSAVDLEECSEGLLWVGSVTDDDGKEVHGLHIATAEYPEEGSTTLVEFDASVTTQAPIGYISQSVVDMLNNGDHVPATICSATKSRTNRHPGPDASWQVPIFTHADAGQVERLQGELDAYKASRERLHGWIREEQLKNVHLNAQLAERDALLRRCLMSVREQHCDEGEAEFDLPVQLMAEIDAALSTSAEPSLSAAEHEQ